MKHAWIILILSSLIALITLSGCTVLPTYTVRVDNQSSKAIMARLERRPTMNNMVEMASAHVSKKSSKVLGPMEAPPLERVYIVIQSPSDLHALPDSHKIKRGNWVVTISDGSSTSWGAYEISVRRE